MCFEGQNKSPEKIMFATGETVGLAEWIINDTCLVIRNLLIDGYEFVLNFQKTISLEINVYELKMLLAL